MNKLFVFIIVFFVFSTGRAQVKLLTDKELSSADTYVDLNIALSTPEAVIVLDLTNYTDPVVLESKIGKFKNLQKLVLGKDQITKIPDEAGSLQYLQVVSFEGNKISEIPASFCNLKNLRTLNLSETQIKTLPAAFSQLQNLQVLNLSYNQLSSAVLAPVYQLSRLSVLNLEHNQIETIGSEIKQLVNLSDLNLNFNPINSLPEEFGLLQNLEYLDLGKNSDLHTLPASFSKLTRLIYLNLESVPLSSDEKLKIPKLSEDAEINFGGDNE